MAFLLGLILVPGTTTKFVTCIPTLILDRELGVLPGVADLSVGADGLKEVLVVLKSRVTALVESGVQDLSNASPAVSNQPLK